MSVVIEKKAEKADNVAELLSVKPNLIGMTRDSLAEALKPLGVEAFRTKQIWQWLYQKGVTDFSAMSNIKKDVQQKLADAFTIERAGIARNAVSFDATQKWLLKFADGNEVETVFIPDAERGTLCVSSQVGCTLACTFCHTGTQRLVRNLTASEIITQVLVAKDGLKDWNKPSDSARALSNIVFMGMGEPLFNYDHVVTACNVLLDHEGLNLSRRKVTVSTSGVVPKIVPLAKDAGVNLAISLHAVTNELRNEIVPINRKYPIEELLDACREYVSIVKDRRIMFEYVMLKGVNDSDEDAKRLVQLLKGIPSKVNLIPFNPWPGAPYECSSNNRIHSFGRIIIAGGIASPIRKTRGDDIMAACGQLKSLSELKKGQKVKLK
ncbi:MAG: 23S rRNA (adenine(2503)-C(2))-methyltransferase RlmN [Alphaproteobacteria bacterium]|nr:23S rRNA (adenine(2503)-C(2))-methyltransferase RlmN [Alphaproteobacteria bacterium]